jgi:hypothetical protein
MEKLEEACEGAPTHIRPKQDSRLISAGRTQMLGRYIHLWTSDPNLLSRRTAQAFSRGIIVWISTFAAFVALVLTAMQVGLATTYLQENDTFQHAAYIFAIWAIVWFVAALAIAFGWHGIWQFKHQLPRFKQALYVGWYIGW